MENQKLRMPFLECTGFDKQVKRYLLLKSNDG